MCLSRCHCVSVFFGVNCVPWGRSGPEPAPAARFLCSSPFQSVARPCLRSGRMDAVVSVTLWAEGRASVQRAHVQWSASVMSRGLLLNLSLCSCHVASPRPLLVAAGQRRVPSLPAPRRAGTPSPSSYPHLRVCSPLMFAEPWVTEECAVSAIPAPNVAPVWVLPC